MEYNYIECKCESAEHTIRFVEDKNENEISVEIQLSQYMNVFQRIWNSIKYICGYKCKYGHWDVTLIKNEDRERIIKLLAGNPL